MNKNKIKILLIAVIFLSTANLCQARDSLEEKLAKLEAAAKVRQSSSKSINKAVGKTTASVQTSGRKKTLAERLAELEAKHKKLQRAGDGRDSRISTLESKLEALVAKSQSQQSNEALVSRITEIEQKLRQLQERSKSAEVKAAADSANTEETTNLGQNTKEISKLGSNVRILAAGTYLSPAKSADNNLSGANPKPVKAGPKYKNLRYDEDFSYLGGPEGSYIKDSWDSIKWIPLNDDWHLTLGGQARLRFESETDKSFGGGSGPSHDSFLLQRYFIHTDLKHADGLRFFLQGKFAHVNNRDKGGKAGLEDHADIHQAFGDIPLGSTTLRLGRQELQYGKQRLISPLDWGNLRRTFDGIKMFGETSDLRWDAFAVRPVITDRRNLDDGDEQKDFYGLYTTLKGSKALKADFYFLLLKDNNTTTNSNSRSGRRTLYTIGNRLYGKRGNWDYETEGAAQFGTYAGDRVRAWMATVGGGYTFKNAAWKPRIGLLYDYASGDRNPSDGTHSTFNQLFPLGHAYFGYLDRVGRSNVHAIKAQLKVKPSKKVTAWADFHTFFADQDRDSLYGANGASIRSGGAGGSHKFGHELDLTMKYAIDKHTTALAGWAHFWPGGFVKRTGTSEDADFIYAQVEYKF